MLFDLRRVSTELARSLSENPEDIFFFLHGSEPYEPPKGLLKRLLAPKPPPRQQRQWEAPAADTVMTLEKNWHVLHYLLSRAPWEGPLPQSTLMAGTELGSIDVGYGPARMINPGQIEEFLEFLNSLSEAEFSQDVTAAELEENAIYGAYPGWNSQDAASLWKYVEEMKVFFSEAVSREESVILYMY